MLGSLTPLYSLFSNYKTAMLLFSSPILITELLTPNNMCSFSLNSRKFASEGLLISQTADWRANVACFPIFKGSSALMNYSTRNQSAKFNESFNSKERS